MKIYESAVKRPITTALFFVALVVTGIFFFTQLPIDLIPNMDQKIISITVPYPGASAEEVEENITKPIENNLSSIQGLTKITSESKNNISFIMLQFDYSSKSDKVMEDIREKISVIASSLPKGSTYPIIYKFSTSEIPILLYNITSSGAISDEKEILENKLVKRISRVNGVGQVALLGIPSKEVHIDISQIKLDAYHLTIGQVTGAIQATNLNVPGGSFEVGTQNYHIQISDKITSIDRLKNLIVSITKTGILIKISDVANVSYKFSEGLDVFSGNLKKTGMLLIQKQNDANSLQVINAVKKEMNLIKKELPPGIQIETMLDVSKWINQSLGSLSKTIVLILIIVTLVVFLFLGRWRASIIILTTIPISLIASFIYLHFSGNSLNMITMSALAIAIGLVVDDAIVSLENITHHIDRGSSPKLAAIYGTNEVVLSIITTSATIAAVFLPMIMLHGEAGVLFRVLGVMVTIIIAVSTLSALTLTPMMASRMLKRDAKRSRFEIKYEKWLSKYWTKLELSYLSAVKKVVHNRKKSMLAFFAIFVVIILIIGLKGLKTENMPKADNSFIEFTYELASGTRKEMTQNFTKKFIKWMNDNIDGITTINAITGNPSAKDVGMMGSITSNKVLMYIHLKSPKKRKESIFKIGERLRKKLSESPIVSSFNVSPGGNNGGVESAAITINISGQNLEELQKVSTRIRKQLKQLDGVENVKSNASKYVQQYKIIFDDELLMKNGLSIYSASIDVSSKIRGATVGTMSKKGTEHDIIVRYDKDDRSSVEEIKNISIMNAMGNVIKLGEVAQVEPKMILDNFTHLNRERNITLEIVKGDKGLNEIYKEVNEVLEKSKFPKGITYSIGGVIVEQQKSFKGLFFLMLFASFMVFAVMASEFESLVNPFIIMFSVPFAIIGSLFTLSITNNTLDLMSFIGIIMLVGIIVKNGIVMIDYINLYRERGRSLFIAIVTGAQMRLRPILMTSLTTILGMLPFIFDTGEGAEMWKTLGIAFVGGLTFATFITLFLIPTLYAIFSARKLKKQQKKLRLKIENESNTHRI